MFLDALVEVFVGTLNIYFTVFYIQSLLRGDQLSKLFSGMIPQFPGQY